MITATSAVAAAVSPLVGLMGEETALPMGLAMVTSTVLAALAFGVLTRRGGARRDGAATGTGAGAVTAG